MIGLSYDFGCGLWLVCNKQQTVRYDSSMKSMRGEKSEAK
jgi:hypothetical protein